MMSQQSRHTGRRTGAALLATGLASMVLAPVAASAQPGSEELRHRDRGTAVSDWNAYAGKAAVAACISPIDDPLHESRMYAMAHVAIHDALNAIERRYQPYAADFRAPRGASATAAVAAAAHAVLVPSLQELPAPFPPSCIEAGVASVEADYAAALAQIRDGRAKTQGIKVGEQAAAGILAKRTGDGSDTTLIDAGYPEGTTPGAYRFTPGTPFAFAPGWADVTPFVLRDASQFRPDAPYDVSSRRYARDLNEVQRLGGDDITTASERTSDQTQVARFWVESSPLAWNRLTRGVVADQQMDSLWKQARLFALLNLGMADGYIATFDTKYLYNFWRPVTAIQNADTDGNPGTTADPTWTPLVQTPPIPDYDSGHSVEGGVAAGVLRRFFGTDRMRFQACSFTLPAGQTCNDTAPVLRSYTRFSQAAQENADSRIYVGFHFRLAIEVGVDHGDRIAGRTYDRYLRPWR